MYYHLIIQGKERVEGYSVTNKNDFFPGKTAKLFREIAKSEPERNLSVYVLKSCVVVPEENITKKTLKNAVKIF